MELAILLGDRCVGPANMHAALGHLEVLRRNDVQSLRIDRDRGRALDGVGDGLGSDPAAGVARQRPAVEAEVQVVLHVGRVQDRYAAVDQRMLALVGDRRGLGARVVAVDIADDKLAFARQMGAAATINASTTTNVPASVRELTGGVYFGKKWRDGEQAEDVCSYSRAEIEREEHLLAGARRCVYRVRRAPVRRRAPASAKRPIPSPRR